MSYGRGHRLGERPRRPRAPLTPAQTAARIVASIRLRIAEGRPWSVEEYTTKTATRELVKAILEGTRHER